MRENIPITEPMAVPDVFISGLHSIENIGGGCVRLTCFVNQISVHDGTPERVVCLRMVMPRESIIPSMFMAGLHVGWHFAGELPGGEG